MEPTGNRVLYVSNSRRTSFEASCLVSGLENDQRARGPAVTEPSLPPPGGTLVSGSRGASFLSHALKGCSWSLMQTSEVR
jgi:hypothetical protein